MVVLAGVKCLSLITFLPKIPCLGLLNFRCSTVLIISVKGHFTLTTSLLSEDKWIIDFKIVIFLVLNLTNVSPNPQREFGALMILKLGDCSLMKWLP